MAVTVGLRCGPHPRHALVPAAEALSSALRLTGPNNSSGVENFRQQMLEVPALDGLGQGPDEDALRVEGGARPPRDSQGVTRMGMRRGGRLHGQKGGATMWVPMTVTPEETARMLLRRFGADKAEATERARTLRRAAAEVIPQIARQLGATRVFLFGSLVWGGANDRSDIDLAVEGITPARIDDFGGEAIMRLPARVDVVRLEDAPPSLATRILESGELLFVAGVEKAR